MSSSVQRRFALTEKPGVLSVKARLWFAGHWMILGAGLFLLRPAWAGALAWTGIVATALGPR